MCSLQSVSPGARNEGMRNVRSTREINPHVFALYFNAAVSSHFLRTGQGRAALAAADEASHALLAAAHARHRASASGAHDAAEWGLIRKLYPDGPGALHLWAREAHYPPATHDGVFRPRMRRLCEAGEECCRAHGPAIACCPPGSVLFSDAVPRIARSSVGTDRCCGMQRRCSHSAGC